MRHDFENPMSSLHTIAFPAVDEIPALQSLFLLNR